MNNVNRAFKRTIRVRTLMVGILGLVLAQAGCTTLKELAALHQVAFAIDEVTNADLAGINVSTLRSFDDFRPMDALKIANAVRQKELPFSFTLNLAGENPEDNTVQARLTKLDWTLFIEDRETVSGVFDDEIVLPPGQAVNIPIGIQLDLYNFFDENLADMVDLALNVAGKGGEPKQIRLMAQPTIDTALGPIQYPGTITIVNKQVGS